MPAVKASLSRGVGGVLRRQQVTDPQQDGFERHLHVQVPMGLPLQFFEIVDQVQQFVDVDAFGQRLHAGFLIQIEYMIGAGADGNQEHIAQPT